MNNIANFIDHTNLSPLAVAADIKKLCEEALKHHFKAVCVAPYHVKTVADMLGETKVNIATVVGFPFGYATIAPKVEEIRRAIDDGAYELDVVANLAAIKEGRWNFVQNEIDILTTSCQLHGKVIKVIIETAVLTDDEIKKMCEICATVGANFVKTSTGFNGGGATAEVVAMMRAYLPKGIEIKASGGIRTLAEAEAMIAAGATRIGTSSGMKMIQN
jgi:deoxyribose-phosphate aldolase